MFKNLFILVITVVSLSFCQVHVGGILATPHAISPDGKYAICTVRDIYTNILVLYKVGSIDTTATIITNGFSKNNVIYGWLADNKTIMYSLCVSTTPECYVLYKFDLSPYINSGYDAVAKNKSLQYKSGSKIYPNPASRTTPITIGLDASANSIVQIVDLSGKIVRVINSGNRALVSWDCLDNFGKKANPGQYLVMVNGVAYPDKLVLLN